nr:probable rhamnogalacturonate lyase B [Ipomoea batatas]GMC56801.1 probable rhamnogalacturonate lyase B [Ipomoea batatas]GMD22384.1 probable rhamnogalacturonate lyase B [Ipomoea batatas]GMD28217.1 probable rhamnogalacturonate lyase B [Ipomoea batatas]GME11975.1 probable rhamnogalacturonate lyase B [Ipomoea batatas]
MQSRLGSGVAARWFVDERSVALYAYVGLAMPSAPRSWQRENKRYQFWTQADNDGNFFIKGVRARTYNLYATVPGRIGGFGQWLATPLLIPSLPATSSPGVASDEQWRRRSQSDEPMA